MNARKAALLKKLKDKKYRDAYVASQIRVGVPFQVRAIRARLGWDQSELAEKAGMAQPRISAIETAGGSSFNLNTLRRIASAFDVGLIVRFAPFSELIRFDDTFSPDEFKVAGFATDMAAMTGPPGPTAKVVELRTGKPYQAVPSDDEKPARQVTATIPSWVQGARQEARTKESAETENEYREVSRG